MKHYCIDEFIIDEHNTYMDKKADIIDKKISLLHDFCILSRLDKREMLVRVFLDKYNTEAQMTRVLHDVLVGNKTLDEMLRLY